jgi:flagellin-like hook-associated protein FlgL
MSITKIGSDQVLFYLNQATNKIDSLAHKFSTGRRISSPKEGSSEWVQVSQGRFAFDDLQALNAIANSAAKSIKVADSTMGRIETLIDQMKEQLGRIIKNYPPFLPGTEERVKFLRSFTALRRQIDQLSFAPDYKEVVEITADPVTVPKAGDGEAAVGNRGPRTTILNQQVSIDAAGLNIPELSEKATDAEIQAAIESLQDAEKALAQKRSELAANALSIQQFLEFNTKFDKSLPSYPEAVKSADMTDVTAEIKSSENKQMLMIESTKSLTEDPSQLLELIK